MKTQLAILLLAAASVSCEIAGPCIAAGSPCSSLIPCCQQKGRAFECNTQDQKCEEVKCIPAFTECETDQTCCYPSKCQTKHFVTQCWT